ncbi:hypothetical protein [Pseudoroseomonas cervicalis]|uniref:hypothetical protein n=1 Tax=Teichococcus cervicalis TaxID=204525 RepID=UPI0022F17C91|nr:hypothetical protein [Pseudoroseomonas cervicalis]WBV43212.1 hypothetical protein PFY06_01180 [Pseudoroseomonas cervicalis]
MRDMTGSRLWPLALMGWLAAYPPVDRDARAETVPGMVEPDSSRCRAAAEGERTAWLRAARQRYAGMPAEQRAALRQARRSEAGA